MVPHLTVLGGAFVILTSSAVAVAGPARGKAHPAWPGVFIELGNYIARYESPVVEKGEKPTKYQQRARYDWSGGRFEVIEITLARDPAFKDRYSAEVMKKEKTPPKEVEINKKKAWLWEFQPEQGKLDKVVKRLVVLLDVEKAIIIEQKGFGADLREVAAKFDFAKVEKALAKPPAK